MLKVKMRDVVISEHNLPRRRSNKTQKKLKQGRLADSIGTFEQDDLARPKLEAESRQAQGATRIPERNVLKADTSVPICRAQRAVARVRVLWMPKALEHIRSVAGFIGQRDSLTEGLRLGAQEKKGDQKRRGGWACEEDHQCGAKRQKGHFLNAAVFALPEKKPPGAAFEDVQLLVLRYDFPVNVAAHMKKSVKASNPPEAGAPLLPSVLILPHSERESTPDL